MTRASESIAARLAPGTTTTLDGVDVERVDERGIASNGRRWRRRADVGKNLHADREIGVGTLAQLIAAMHFVVPQLDDGARPADRDDRDRPRRRRRAT